MATEHIHSAARPTWLAAVETKWRQWQTERKLMACSDRVLTDIGIAREDIPLIARGKDPLQHEADISWSGWLPGLLAWLDEVREDRRELRRIRRELASYNDRDLDELGIRRGDIPALLKDGPRPAAA
ncbi:MAG TPA: DUF1127 domain-containing protein [Geminicoccaceae bacterium]|nr:DUF1127 domain-containing protein [Geminicoccaceae bacterium]